MISFVPSLVMVWVVLFPVLCIRWFPGTVGTSVVVRVSMGGLVAESLRRFHDETRGGGGGGGGKKPSRGDRLRDCLEGNRTLVDRGVADAHEAASWRRHAADAFRRGNASNVQSLARSVGADGNASASVRDEGLSQRLGHQAATRSAEAERDADRADALARLYRIQRDRWVNETRGAATDSQRTDHMLSSCDNFWVVASRLCHQLGVATEIKYTEEAFRNAQSAIATEQRMESLLVERETWEQKATAAAAEAHLLANRSETWHERATEEAASSRYDEARAGDDRQRARSFQREGATDAQRSAVLQRRSVTELAEARSRVECALREERGATVDVLASLACLLPVAVFLSAQVWTRRVKPWRRYVRGLWSRSRSPPPHQCLSALRPPRDVVKVSLWAALHASVLVTVLMGQELCGVRVGVVGDDDEEEKGEWYGRWTVWDQSSTDVRGSTLLQFSLVASALQTCWDCLLLRAGFVGWEPPPPLSNNVRTSSETYQADNGTTVWWFLTLTMTNSVCSFACVLMEALTIVTMDRHMRLLRAVIGEDTHWLWRGWTVFSGMCLVMVLFGFLLWKQSTQEQTKHCHSNNNNNNHHNHNPQDPSNVVLPSSSSSSLIRHDSRSRQPKDVDVDVDVCYRSTTTSSSFGSLGSSVLVVRDDSSSKEVVCLPEPLCPDTASSSSYSWVGGSGSAYVIPTPADGAVDATTPLVSVVSLSSSSSSLSAWAGSCEPPPSQDPVEGPRMEACDCDCDYDRACDRACDCDCNRLVVVGTTHPRTKTPNDHDHDHDDGPIPIPIDHILTYLWSCGDRLWLPALCWVTALLAVLLRTLVGMTTHWIRTSQRLGRVDGEAGTSIGGLVSTVLVYLFVIHGWWLRIILRNETLTESYRQSRNDDPHRKRRLYEEIP